MSVEEAAARVAERECGAEFDGFGVVRTDSPVVRRIPNRRAVSRDKELGRLASAATAVATRLLETRDVGAAREVARASGFGDCLTVTRSREELVDAIAVRFRAGDNVWAATGSASKALVSLHFWYDKSHRRLF